MPLLRMTSSFLPSAMCPHLLPAPSRQLDKAAPGEVLLLKGGGGQGGLPHWGDGEGGRRPGPGGGGVGPGLGPQAGPRLQV